MGLFQDAFGSSGAYFKFTNPGDSVGGKIVAMRQQQANKFLRGQSTNEPDTWDDGRPKMQFVITVETALRDPSVDGDNGARDIYVKTWGEQAKAMKLCHSAAGLKPGEDFAIGGTFTATYTGLGAPDPASAMSPAKLFSYQYTAPGASVSAAFNTQAPAAVHTQGPAALQGGGQTIPLGPPLAPVAPPANQFEQALYAPPAAPAAPTPPPAPPAPPAAPPAPPAPPAAPQVDPLAVKTAIQAWQAQGWTDQQIIEHPQFPYRAELANLGAGAAQILGQIRNGG